MSRLTVLKEKLFKLKFNDLYIFIALALITVPVLFISDLTYTGEELKSLHFWFNQFYKEGYVFLLSYGFLALFLKNNSIVKAILSFIISFVVDNIIQVQFSFSDKSEGYICLAVFIELCLILTVLTFSVNNKVLVAIGSIKDESKKFFIKLIWILFKLITKITLIVLFFILLFCYSF